MICVGAGAVVELCGFGRLILGFCLGVSIDALSTSASLSARTGMTWTRAVDRERVEPSVQSGGELNDFATKVDWD